MILAIDIGTTTLKAGLIDETGEPAGLVIIPLRSETSAAGPAEWLSALSQAVRTLGRGKLRRIRALAVSGNGPTLVPVAADGKPTGTPLSWFTPGSIEHGAPLGTLPGVIDPNFFLVKALMFRDTQPELYEKTRWLLPCPEFASFALTGEAFAFLPSPDYAGYYWSREAAALLGLDADKFPPFILMGERCGRVTKSAAKRFLIPEGTEVISGGPDFAMSLLGTGTVAPGRTCDRAGSSEGINHCSTTRAGNPRLSSFPHLSPGLFNVSAVLRASGLSLDWIVRLFGRSGAAAVSNADRLFASHDRALDFASAVPPGANGLVFLPYLLGPRTGGFAGLAIRHGKSEMFRAVIESTGFVVRRYIDALEADGFDVDEIRVSGGPAFSPRWCSMRADITGKPLLVPRIVNAELGGCACVALAALGEFRNPVESSETIVRFTDTYRPDRGDSARYDEAYEVFCHYDELSGGSTSQKIGRE